MPGSSETPTNAGSTGKIVPPVPTRDVQQPPKSDGPADKVPGTYSADKNRPWPKDDLHGTHPELKGWQASPKKLPHSEPPPGEPSSNHPLSQGVVSAPSTTGTASKFKGDRIDPTIGHQVKSVVDNIAKKHEARPIDTHGKDAHPGHAPNAPVQKHDRPDSPQKLPLDQSASPPHGSLSPFGNDTSQTKSVFHDNDGIFTTHPATFHENEGLFSTQYSHGYTEADHNAHAFKAIDPHTSTISHDSAAAKAADIHHI